MPDTSRRSDVLFVFGTRPEAIKMAPLIHRINQSGRLRSRVCVTAQHREMLDSVLGVFAIHPDYDLDLMSPGQDLACLTAKVIHGVTGVLKSEDPRLILVQGDTTTSMAAALAGFYRKVPVGHVEAGLRTHDMSAPWPEEMNRQVTARVATYHFAPTEGARRNLLNEAIGPERIYVTGNTVIDALHSVVARLESDKAYRKAIIDRATAHISAEALQRRIVLITGHRRESFGEGFRGICSAICQLAQDNPSITFVYPVHSES